MKYTETWIDMVRESGPPNWASMQWYDAMEAFTAGQAGMIADADFFAANYEDPKKSKVAGKVGYALLPVGPGGKTYSGLWTWALGISNATKNKDAAWLFVQWATAPRTLLNATVNYRNYNPSRMSVTNDPRVQEIMGVVGRRQLPQDRGQEPRDGQGGLDAAVRAAAGRRHLGARPARDLLPAHVGGRRAQEGEQRGRQGAEGSRHQVAALRP